MPPCMYVHVCAVPTEAKRKYQIHWNWVIGGCEPPHGYWDLNLGPLQGQPVILATEPWLQPPYFFIGFNHLHLSRAAGQSHQYPVLYQVSKPLQTACLCVNFLKCAYFFGTCIAECTL